MLYSLAETLKNIKNSISTIANNTKNIVTSINSITNILGISSGLNSDGSSNGVKPGTVTSAGSTSGTNPTIMNNKITNIENKFSTSYNTNPGDVLRADSSGKLTGGKMLHVLRAGGTTDDIKKLSTTKISMLEIFQSWDRISCESGNGANQNASTSDQVLARASYYYDKANELIICSRNSDSYSAFISSEDYGNDWTIEYRMDQRYAPGNGGDNDLLQFVIAYMVDSKGKFHTISINRMSGSSEHGGHGFTLAYDLYTAFQDDSKSPADWIKLGEVTVNQATWYNNYTKVKVVRTPTSITAQTADPNQDNYAYTISWTLSSSKPNAWPQEAWDNIQHMMGSRCKIGFGTQSNISAFKVDANKNLFDEITVYDLSSGTKDTYKDGTKIKSESCDISLLPNSLIYSTLNEKLFYYRGNGTCSELLPKDAINAEILTLKNNLAQLAMKVDPNFTFS